LISRDIESASGPIAFGHKFMTGRLQGIHLKEHLLTNITGGAGEGDQQLHPDGSFEHRQEVKRCVNWVLKRTH
jgi:hypothetical protein